MKTIRVIILSTLLVFIYACQNQEADDPNWSGGAAHTEFGMVIHGGAGSIHKGRYTPEQEEAYNAKLKEALLTGYAILKDGGSSVDAVEKTIRVLENSPLFNAGKGAVLTNAETAELDAAIMSGADLNAGTCAGIKHVKNPISLARMIMDSSKHVMLIGEGAEKFARDEELEIVDNSYFITDKRLEEIRKIKAKERKKNERQTAELIQESDHKFGTVGCVALDKNGNLAAGTSTGGLSNKKWGRVGDVPIIGAGTYANNKTCALSATGQGEYFIRNVVTHDISALMEYKDMTLTQAADNVIMEKLVEQHGAGGVIGIDHRGNIIMSFNTQGMFRGFIKADGELFTAMYK